jgi:hypothetical protein
MIRRRATNKRGITTEESAMDTNTKTKTNTKTSAISEIRELIDNEPAAVNGGAFNAYVSQGGGAGAGKVEQYQTGGSHG